MHILSFLEIKDNNLRFNEMGQNRARLMKHPG